VKGVKNLKIVSLNPLERQKNIIETEGAKCPFCKNSNIEHKIGGVLDKQCYDVLPNLQQIHYECKDCGTYWQGNYYDNNWNHVMHNGEDGYRIVLEAPLIREEKVKDEEGKVCPVCKHDEVMSVKAREVNRYYYECIDCGSEWVGNTYNYDWTMPLTGADNKYRIIRRSPKFNKESVFDVYGKMCPSCYGDSITSEIIEYDTGYKFIRFTCNECKTVWESSVYDRDWNYVSEEYIPPKKHQDSECVNYKTPSKEAFSLISTAIWIVCGLFLLEKTVELIEFGDMYTVLEMLFIVFFAILLFSVIGIIKILCHNKKR